MTDRSELIYGADTPDWEIIMARGDELIEQMEEHGLATDEADEWSDGLQKLLVRKYRVPDGPERIFVEHQIEAMLARAVKARAEGER
jgi:hypothetical protein